MSVNIIITPPPGETIDYKHSASRGWQVNDANWISFPFAATLVCIRLAVRIGLTHNCGWDDFCMVLSLFFAIGPLVADALVINRYGIGHHSWDVPLKNYEPALNIFQISNILYLMSIMLAKVSILLFYNRLFGVNKRFRLISYAAMAFVATYCVASAFTIVFQCTPPKAAWHLLLRITSRCLSIIKIDIAIGAFNIASDIFILVLPLPMLWRLRMPVSQRLGLIVVMATGIFVCITAIIREIILVTTFDDKDEAWSVCDSMIWLTLEMNVAIVCGCLPILSPLSRYLRDKIPLSSIRSFSIKSLGFFSTQSSHTRHSSSMWSSKSQMQDKQCLKAGWLCSTKERSSDGDSEMELAPAEVRVPGLRKDHPSVPVIVRSCEIRDDQITGREKCNEGSRSKGLGDVQV